MTDTKRIIIIGASAAGPKAASRARRLDESAEIMMFQKEDDVSMATCAYPYYAGGIIKNRLSLFSTQAGEVRDSAYYLKSKNIILRTRTEITEIDPQKHTVSFKNLETGETGSLGYSKLIIATGAFPVMPDIPGNTLKGVTCLRSLRDADYLKEICSDGKSKKAVVIGGGALGLEICEALCASGLFVTIVESAPYVMNSMDPEMSLLIEKYLIEKNITVLTGRKALEFAGNENGHIQAVKLDDGSLLECETAVISTGVIPDIKLAEEAGITIGRLGGIIVNQHMQTSDFDIYAAGDCVESRDTVTGANVYMPLGDMAAIQGRVAGENAAKGNRAMFTGTSQSVICKVFEHVIASTGLTEKAAILNNYEFETIVSAGFDKPAYMGGKTIVTKIIMEKFTDRVLGAQSVGTEYVSRLIASYGMAIKGGLSITDMCSADFPYAPPFSTPVDAGITAMHALENKVNGLMKTITSLDLKERLDSGEALFILDVRTSAEFENARIDNSAVNIPLAEIRERLAEFPENQKSEIICYCQIGLRAYEAARVLMQKGRRNIKVLEGGLAAWPHRLVK
ncbi:MAG: FAD-dependent oxidoreductase [Leptospirales bacterium]|nr:FAD-dependent oxidoreductase [Leptospirales bacterium]